MKRKSRKSQNQGNPDADKMSEAGLGGLEDLQDFFWNYEKEI
jgi:hypothetical protein